ncbi:hypothetical protein UFOVP679_14 [uncultured Caudovirales phage]|uniref:Uncharacterized protein n=1 Tax=uncultured Caudovirales phage TaxID=2100421 RepID=A0A6J5NJA6_9CAUD|nr:hypothetical protein UFOVP679_14 [uncultured Caudovirales phage]
MTPLIEQEPVEVLMFGPHDVEAGHELALDAAASLTETAIGLGRDDLPAYYIVLALIRTLARISVAALPGYSDGVMPMVQKALEQERVNFAKAVQQ